MAVIATVAISGMPRNQTANGHYRVEWGHDGLVVKCSTAEQRAWVSHLGESIGVRVSTPAKDTSQRILHITR